MTGSDGELQARLEKFTKALMAESRHRQPLCKTSGTGSISNQVVLQLDISTCDCQSVLLSDVYQTLRSCNLATTSFSLLYTRCRLLSSLLLSAICSPRRRLPPTRYHLYFPRPSASSFNSTPFFRQLRPPPRFSTSPAPPWRLALSSRSVSKIQMLLPATSNSSCPSTSSRHPLTRQKAKVKEVKSRGYICSCY